MKKRNQTISLRDLVKKMKHHSTRTIVVTATVMAILCGGMIYAFFPIQDVKAQEKEVLSVQPSQSEMQEQLTSILEYLQELDKTVMNNQKMLADAEKKTQTSGQEVEVTVEKQGESVIKSVSEIETSMSAIHERIAETGQQIADLQTSLNQTGQQSQQDMEQQFKTITGSMDQISQSYTQAQTQTEALLRNMSDEEKANHGDLVGKLTDMQAQMVSADVQNLTDMAQKLKNLEELYKKELADLQIHVDGSITEMDSHMSEQFNTLNTSVSNQYQTIQQQFGDDNNEIFNLISDSRKDVNDKFDQVFRRVSDGKKLLASTLLTKGVAINGDATFAELAQAISNMPQQMLIGVEKIPGTVTYEYHHHIKADGSEGKTEQVGTDEQGGCYSIAVYHIHSGDPYNGGGCYTVPRYHQHGSSCYTSISYDTSTNHVLYDLDRENGELYHMYHCDVCGSEFKSTNGGHKHYETRLVCGKNSGTIEAYQTGCGMTADTVIGYRPGCGLSEGQIIAAHILYKTADIQKTEQVMLHASETDLFSAEQLAENKTAAVDDSLPLAECITFDGVIEKDASLESDTQGISGEDKTGEKESNEQIISPNTAESNEAAAASASAATETADMETP